MMPEEELQDCTSADAECFDGFIPADDEHIAREKRKAAELRKTQWWKNQLARCRCHYCGGTFKPSELTMDQRLPPISRQQPPRPPQPPAPFPSRVYP